MEQSKLGGPQISLSETTAVECPECGSKIFKHATHLRKISPVLTGTAQAGIMPIPVFVCEKCGAILKELLPEELKELI